MVKTNCPLMCKLCKPDPDAEADKCPPAYGRDIVPVAGDDIAVAESTKLVNSTISPASGVIDDKDDKVVGDDDNGSQHPQQCSNVARLFCVILSLTITWQALL